MSSKINPRFAGKRDDVKAPAKAPRKPRGTVNKKGS